MPFLHFFGYLEHLGLPLPEHPKKGQAILFAAKTQNSAFQSRIGPRINIIDFIEKLFFFLLFFSIDSYRVQELPSKWCLKR